MAADEHGEARGGSRRTSGHGRPSARSHPNQGDEDSTSDRQHSRRFRVLTQTAASTAKGIADAIVIKAGEPFFLCRPNGQLAIGEDHGLGLYYHDMRFVAGYEVRLGGTVPSGLASSAASGDAMVLELTNEDFEVDGVKVDKETLAVRWQRRLERGRVRLRDTITVKSHADRGLDIPVQFSFAPGFDDVMAIRGLLPIQPGTCHDPKWERNVLVFQYDGKDGVVRHLTISSDPDATERNDNGFELRLRIPAGGETTINVELEASERVEKGAAPVERRTTHRRRSTRGRDGQGTDESDWVGGNGWSASIRTDSLAVNTVLRRCLDDLRLLRGELDGRRYYAAGIPWFSTLFGRDSLLTAYETLAVDRDVAGDTLRLLAGRQGTRIDHWRDETPGKILHELRIGELARLDEIPQTPYYGSIDSTLLFLILLARHAEWTGSLDVFHEIHENVERALDWIADYGDGDGDGYVEYKSSTTERLVNQGWKDSGNAIVNADGGIADPPIALAEVQGYVYAAKVGVADLYERDGNSGRAERLRREAQELRERFERDFWSDDLGCYVLARNGPDTEQRCEVVTSNAGQVLWSGLSSAEHARAVCERLFRDDMFNGWGIRTLSSDAKAYWPIGYHLGTVWPHDNALIASGLRRYGFDDAAQTIFESILETALQYEHQRLPECFGGYSRADFGVPVRYPTACHPQAWAAGSVPLLLVANLGLQPEAFSGVLRIERPRLPRFVDRLEIRDLRVGDASVGVVFTRSSEGVAVETTDVRGNLKVEVVAAG